MSSLPRQLVHDAEGLNTGTWPPPADSPITPTHLFFLRSHAPIPVIDPETWRLEVGGLVERPHSFSLSELVGSFPRRAVTATLVCAGLRRDEFLSLGPLSGELPWGPEPAGTGEWTGVALADLLRLVGVRGEARHVELIGLDQVERNGLHFGFGASINLTKASGDEVLLATHLNGSPLPLSHGYPLRAVVPGWIGARSVKWLGRITLRTDATDNYFQTQAYRLQRQINPDNPRDVSSGVALTELPVNSVIYQPEANQVLPAGRISLRGWALGSGARPVVRVEVSAAPEQAWTRARLLPQESAWAWSFWEAELELEPGRHTLVVRATDSSGNTQPMALTDTWNVKGYANNAWHRVPIQVE